MWILQCGLCQKIITIIKTESNLKIFWRSNYEMEVDLQVRSLWPRIEHLLKNKLQGYFGGSFLVESGLKSGNLETVNRGWQIVSSNQIDIVRCINQILLLSRQTEYEPERSDLRELVQLAIEEIDGLPDRKEYMCGIEYQRPATPVEVWGEPSLIRSAILGLLRIFLEANRGSLETKVVVEHHGNQLDVICHSPQLDLMAISNPDSSLDHRLREVLWIEWGVAEFAINRLHGRLSAGQKDNLNWFQIEWQATDASLAGASPA